MAKSQQHLLGIMAARMVFRGDRRSCDRANELTGLDRCPVERRIRLCWTLSLLRLGRAQADIHLIELEGILLAGTIRRHMLVAIQDIVYKRRSFDLR